MHTHKQSDFHRPFKVSVQISRMRPISKWASFKIFQDDVKIKADKQIDLKCCNNWFWFFFVPPKKKTTTTWNLQVLSMKWCFRFHSFRYDFIENHWKTYSFSFSSYLHVPVKHLPNNNNWFEKIWREKHEVLLGIWNG